MTTTTAPMLAEGEDRWRLEFAASADLRAEFGGDEGAFFAWRRAEATGRARIIQGRGRQPERQAAAETFNPLPASASAADRERLWRAQYAVSAELQAEFGPAGGESVYLAGKHRERRAAGATAAGAGR